VEEERTELLQTQGSVRYEVVPKETRRFVVRAGDVEVNVLGTIFRVDVEPTEVTVRVERGRVEVTQLSRRVKLDAGEVIALKVAGAFSDGPASTLPSVPQPVESSLPSSTSSPTSPPHEPMAAISSPLALLDRANRARAAGDLDDAARVLRDLLRRYPGDARVGVANFVLGRVESARGSPQEAARAFGACVARSPGGALEEDALAEWARAKSRSGDTAGAASLAQRYLATYPSGIHRRAMEHMVVGN
jgi:TolA-binding protein